MRKSRHLHAVLVHERPDCVLDLLRAIRAHDPDSHILLYKGGTDPNLLASLPLNDLRVNTHPRPRPMRWGTLHGFALDCMRHALAHLPFDAMTIVDSDQLPLRPGWPEAVAAALAADPGVGVLSSEPARQDARSCIDPIRAFHAEHALWTPLLRRLPGGQAAFAHWSFWPATVFTANAAAALVRLFDADTELAAILAQSRAWATEEVLLPTLAVALGFRIAANPTAGRYVQFRRSWSVPEALAARADPTAFWLHPVPRRLDDPVRVALREATAPPATPGLLRTLPILAAMRDIEGWLTDTEADLLIAALADAMRRLPQTAALEIGSWCGRSTVALAGALRALGDERRLHAIDPHDGEVSVAGQPTSRMPPTLARLRANLACAGLLRQVEIHVARATDLPWDRPIGFLFIDGLHDAASVAADLAHFVPHLAPGALVAFHDYADYWPGVRQVVDGAIAGGGWTRLALADSLVVLQREALAAPAVARGAAPLVSAIMPTADRAPFVSRAIAAFLRQDHPECELIVVDDGVRPVAGLIPEDPRIRYLREQQRQTVGAKRNIACAEARGVFIAHWDDDDWHAPDRLSRQLAAIADADFCGSTAQLFLDPAAGQAWRYDYAALGDARPWLAGGTLFYRATRWRRAPFEPIDVGEDARFVRAEAAPRLAVVRGDVVVGVIHAGNVSPKRPRPPLWRPVPLAAAAALMGEDWPAFRGGIVPI